jgi:HEPN domain-containing protein
VHRDDLQAVALARLSEAQSLLDSSGWSGAYYLVGYAVECSLKSVIASKFPEFSIPDKRFVMEIHTHDLAQLVRLAGLESDLQSRLSDSIEFQISWSVAKDWSENSRYQLWSEHEARDMCSAVGDASHGVLEWVMEKW